MDLPVKNIVSEIDLKPSDFLLPLFESVVNSIISLKLTKDISKQNKKIQIQVFRGEAIQANTLFPSNFKTISSFKVIDNGEGFTDPNLESFKTAYSHKNKEEFGCKGIGRFTILAGFRKLLIKSYFVDKGIWKYREISFDTEKEVSLITNDVTEVRERKTTIELSDCYNDSIRNNSTKSVSEIAELIMQHCLVYYLCGDLPYIEVYDTESQELAVVNDLYQNLSEEREKSFSVSIQPFHCYITKTQKTNNRSNHYVYYCANSRVVGSGKSIARVNSIFAYPIIDNGYAYFLDVYVVSEYLNKKVYGSRNGFSIPQEREDGLFNSFQNNEITF